MPALLSDQMLDEGHHPRIGPVVVDACEVGIPVTDLVEFEP
jgi:hypothetical protein